jgi:prevent-host-death family protein
MKQKIIPITEARIRLFEIAEEVQDDNTYYTLTKNGRPAVVILSYERFQKMEEMMGAST